MKLRQAKKILNTIKNNREGKNYPASLGMKAIKRNWKTRISKLGRSIK